MIASLQGQPEEALPVLLVSPQELKSVRGHLSLPPSLNRKLLDGQLQVLPTLQPLLCMCSLPCNPRYACAMLEFNPSLAQDALKALLLI